MPGLAKTFCQKGTEPSPKSIQSGRAAGRSQPGAAFACGASTGAATTASIAISRSFRTGPL